MRLWLLPLALSGILVAANTKKEMIPMRDGVRLAASVSLPSGPGPFPAILSRTPNTFSQATDAFVEAGYAVVQQNLRGIQESEGKWTSFTAETQDGYDTVEWIAAQHWSNGKVGVYGSSGSGIAGYLALASAAPTSPPGPSRTPSVAPTYRLLTPEVSINPRCSTYGPGTAALRPRPNSPAP
jgi:hypothetical protein